MLASTKHWLITPREKEMKETERNEKKKERKRRERKIGK
jgi:hypothetical protein